MSISRIESAYAYFLDRKISMAQMAVLQALAYHANEETEECHPSQATLAREVHASGNTINRTCKALQKMGVIDWIPGGQFEGVNVANVYKFLFPRMKMPTRRERYETVLVKRGVPTRSDPRTDTPLPRYQPTVGTGTHTRREGVPTQVGSNTEDNPKSKPKIKSKGNAEGRVPDFDFKFAGCAGRGTGEPDAFDHVRSSPQRAAMKLCGVSDAENNKTFGILMGKLGAAKSWDIVDALASEVRQGEHKNARNLAAILTKRLMAWA